MLRVAQILGKMNGGGVEQVVMNYYKAADRSRVQFDFYLFSGSEYVPAEEIKALGGRLFVLPTFKHPLKYLKTLRRLLSENKYDIMHCHLSTLSFLPLLAGKQSGVRVRILHNHSTSGGIREWHRNLAKLLLKPFARKYATDYFACSEYAARWLYGNIPVCGMNERSPEGSAVIMRNAIDTAGYRFDEKSRCEVRQELHIPENALVFGHIGRFCPQKNQGFLVDIFKEILRENKNSVLVMTGTGGDMELIQARTIAAGISDRVVFTGQRKDAQRLYSSFDCFILPSNYEGLPVVGIEAQCAGLPCLFSDRMTKETGITGLAQFLPLGNPQDWACAALCCAGLRSENAAAEMAAAGYDIYQSAAELTEYYLRKLENDENKAK